MRQWTRTALHSRRHRSIPPRTIFPSSILGLAFLAVTAWGTAGCHPNDPVYFPAEAVITSDGSGMEFQQTLALKFRVPTTSEQSETDKLTAQYGYPVPWLRQDRVHVEMRYTITNLGTEPGAFSLFVDGATEFTRFDYAAVAAAFEAEDEDAPTIGVIQTYNAPILAAGQVYQGTIREDDFREASLDLDAMGRFMAPFLSVLINRSEVNPIGLEMTPTNLAPPQPWILPALWEITPRFKATQPMTLQFVVRVRDDNQRLWDNGDGEFTPAVTTFTPVLPP